MLTEDESVPTRGNSYVSVAYSRIRGMILTSALKPGSRVTVRPLAEELDLSPTPIRTALAALERQGLLEIQEHRGYFVPQLGREDMLEIYELREAVECIAARRAAQSESRPELVERLEFLLEQQQQCVERGDIDGYGELDVLFHKAIWQGSGNRRLVSVSENLLSQVRIGNNISARVPGRLSHGLAEHFEILAALKRGDARAAEAATRRHVRAASVALSRHLQ